MKNRIENVVLHIIAFLAVVYYSVKDWFNRNFDLKSWDGVDWYS